MSFTRTPNLALYKPTPNSDDDAWGGHLNANADTLDALLGTGVGGTFLPLSGGTVTGTFTAPTYLTPGNTQTLSAAQSVAPIANFGANLAGTSTYSGNGYKALIGASGDSLAAPHMSSFDLGLLTNLSAGWQGSRGSLWAYLVTAGNTDLTSSVAVGAGALVSINGAVSSNHNMGGVAAGYGSTQFGLGAQWGCVLQTIVQGGSTWWNSSIGLEIDNVTLNGANLLWNIGLLVNLYPNSQVHASDIDAAQVISAAGPLKWKNGILIGSSQANSIDLTGYYIRGITGRASNEVRTAAGGIDMLQPDFSGIGPGGGGFAFRAQNWSVLNGTGMQLGPGLFRFDSGGIYVDATAYQQANTAAVASGGSNFATTDLLEGTDGSLVSVTTIGAGGAVTGVAFVRRAWARTGAIPANPITFTAQGRSGTTKGTGCTLNLTWLASNGILELQPTGGGVRIGDNSTQNAINIGSTALGNFSVIADTSGGICLDSTSTVLFGFSGNPQIRILSTNAWNANGSVATAMSGVGPPGSHTTVQEWMVIRNSAGVARYIPCF